MKSLYIKSIALRSKTGSSSKPNAHEYFHRARVYVDLDGESVLENLQNRRDRPYNVYKKEVLPTMLRLLGLPVATKLSWSQKAGCSCPCSPGFIDNNEVLPFDIHVTVTDKYVPNVEIVGSLKATW